MKSVRGLVWGWDPPFRLWGLCPHLWLDSDGRNNWDVRAWGIISMRDKEVNHLESPQAEWLSCKLYRQCFCPTHTGNNRHTQLWQETGGGEGSTGGDALHGWDEWEHQACLSPGGLSTQCWLRSRIHYLLVSNAQLMRPGGIASCTVGDFA